MDLAPRRPRSAWRWSIWFSRTPFATVFILLFLRLLTAGAGPFTYRSSPPGGPTFVSGAPDEGAVTVLRRRGQLAVVSPGTEVTSDTVLGAAWYSYRSRSAVSHPLASRTVQGITVSGTGIAPAEVPQVQSLYVQFAAARPERFWRETAGTLAPVASNGGVVISELPFDIRKVVRSILTLFLVGLLVHSLAWLIVTLRTLGRMLEERLAWLALTPAQREARRRARLLGSGRCPRCRYSINGLRENRCPECGERWTAAEFIPPRYAPLIRSGRCPRCRHDITGLRDTRCPQCGTAW
jgi:hypothetical protein